MKLYHGTTTSGITELNPGHKSRLYLTDNYAYSLFYIRDREIDFVTCGIAGNGKVYYDEKFPNQLKHLYQSRQGWVYTGEADAKPTKIRGIYIYEGNVPVEEKAFIPDTYAAIMAEVNKGNVIIQSYDMLTADQREQNNRGIVQELITDRGMNPVRIEFLRKHFPEAWSKRKISLHNGNNCAKISQILCKKV